MRILLMAILMLGTWSLKAAVQVITVSETPSVSNSSGHEIQLPQFDPTLGVLQSVTLDLKGTGAFIEGFNHFPGLGSHRGLASGQELMFTLGLPGGGELITITQHAGHLPGTSNGVRIEPFTVYGHATLTSEPELMAFTGSGFVDLLLSARSGHGHGFGLGTGILGGLWIAGAKINLIYNFTAVPETGTWLAAVFALLIGFGGCRRAFSKA